MKSKNHSLILYKILNKSCYQQRHAFEEHNHDLLSFIVLFDLSCEITESRK